MMLFPPWFWDHSRQQNCKGNSTENSQKPRQLPPRLSSSLEKDQTRKLTLLWHQELNHRRRSHILSLSSMPFFYSGTQWTVPDSIHSLVISLFCPLPAVTSVSALQVSISTFVKNAAQVFCGCPIRSCFLMTRRGLSIWRGAENPAGEAFLPALHQGIQDFRGFPGGSDGKGSACSVGDSGSIPALGRFPGEENGNPLQYSCLENPKDRGAWCATVYEVAKSWTWLTQTHIQDLNRKLKGMSLTSPGLGGVCQVPPL